MTAKISIPRAAITADRRARVSAIDHGLSFVTTSSLNSPRRPVTSLLLEDGVDIAHSLAASERCWIWRERAVLRQMTPFRTPHSARAPIHAQRRIRGQD